MTPYYQGSLITLYNADARAILPDLAKVDLLLTDPPYGIGSDRNLRANQQHGNAVTASRDYGAADWDSEPPDQAMFDALRSRSAWQIIWGGNYFGLPASRCWLVWDKDNGSNGYADCELAWTNLDKAVRRLRHRWMGMLQENMARKEYREHPTQKPESVMAWCLKQAPETCESVLDPYSGSGTTLIATKRAGLKGIGIEIEERYCEMAARRLAQGTPFHTDLIGTAMRDADEAAEQYLIENANR